MTNSTINQLPFGVFNALVPNEGPKVIPLLLDFTAVQSLAVDLTQQQQSGKFSFLQSLLVDNSLNAQTLIIENLTTQQILKIPAGAQGTFPFLCPNPPKFVCKTTGGVQVSIFALNIPMNYSIWGGGPSGTFQFNSDGYLEVSDVALDAIIANGALTTFDAGLNALVSGGGLDVNIISGGGGGAVGGTVLHSSQETQTNTNLFNNTRQNTFTGIDISLSPDAANGVGENGVWNIAVSGSVNEVLASGSIWIPSATPALPLSGSIQLFSMTAQEIAIPAGPEYIEFNWSGTALTSGFFNVNLYGVIT